jgi:hypothetical protein
VPDELASLYHVAADSNHGLHAVSTDDGAILMKTEDIQREVFSFYETIFQGRHVAAAGSDAHVGSDIFYVPEETVFYRFLVDHPSFSKEQRDMLVPFTFSQLATAVKDTADGQISWPKGLHYGLYKNTLHLVGLPL